MLCLVPFDGAHQGADSYSFWSEGMSCAVGQEHIEAIREAFVSLQLDGCVFVGGCRTSTGVAYLNEYLKVRRQARPGSEGPNQARKSMPHSSPEVNARAGP
jgi:hypothetical protein